MVVRNDFSIIKQDPSLRNDLQKNWKNVREVEIWSNR